MTESTALRSRRRRQSARPSGNVGVFTALDGTLLHAETFDPGDNRETISRLRACGIPVVPVTVMTLPEVEPIARDLGFRSAMIIEAGGAIARPSRTTWSVEPTGPEADALLDAIRQVEDRSGARLLVYSALSPADARKLSGRSGAMLAASTSRAFSEPFVIESGRLEDVRRAARAIGFEVRRGRRFFYLCRAGDVAAACARIRGELTIEFSIGIGGSMADVEFLRSCDVAFIIPGSNGDVDEELVRAVRHASIVSSPAPEGWTTAIDACIAAPGVNDMDIHA